MEDGLKKFSVAISAEAHARMRSACKEYGLTTNELLDDVLMKADLAAIASEGAASRKLEQSFATILESAKDLTDEQRDLLIKKLASGAD